MDQAPVQEVLTVDLDRRQQTRDRARGEDGVGERPWSNQ